MLLPLRDIIRKHNLGITGIVHVGAHHGQEYSDYVNSGIKNIVFIEPCKKAFAVLEQKFLGTIPLFNFAIGDRDGEMVMNVEVANEGQSNSILNPKKHLQYYPNIQFHEKEVIEMRRLGSLQIPLKGYNMLMIDVQGYELEVLKGSKEELHNFDYVYAEVNSQELYEGCAMVEDIDSFLSDFKRVETKWTRHGWGDALYVRVKKGSEMIVNVPMEFRLPHPSPYPPGNSPIFEEWYAERATPRTRKYLPIFWTSYYCRNKYGNDKRAIRQLNEYIRTLPKGEKYYTVCQYDDGILNDISTQDIRVYSMCGQPMDYALPLLCKPHFYPAANGLLRPRKITANFIGRITHPIRKELIAKVASDKDFYISTRNHSIINYCKVISESIFTLCPRGYGASSFRIMEAMQYGSIPVYISDEHIEPHGIPFERYGVKLSASDIGNLKEILSSVDIAEKQKAIPLIYKNYFTYERNKAIIELDCNSFSG